MSQLPSNQTITVPPIKASFQHDEFYPYQEPILDLLEGNYNKYEYFILEAPPGVGKTSIADAFIGAHKHGEVLTQQIRLQDQYVKGYGFKKVSGRRNFNCLVESLSCDRGKCLAASEEDICLGCPNSTTCDKSESRKEECENQREINNALSEEFKCDNKPIPPSGENLPDEDFFAAHSNTRGNLYWQKLDDNCPYWGQKMHALNSPKVAHNYAFYLYESNYAGDFGSPEALVCDEAHTIEQTIMDFVTVQITAKELEKIGAPIPNFVDAPSWVTWLNSVSSMYIPRKKSEIRAHLKESENPNHNKKLELKRLTNMERKLNYFLSKYELNPGYWLFLPYVNRSGQFEKVEFKPLIVNDFVEEKLFQASKKKLLMSATILDIDVFKRSLGIQNKTSIFIRIPSPFPVENRPIYKADIGRLDAASIKPSNPDNMLDEIISFIDTTLENPHFRNSKGIVHTTTYSMAEYIMENAATAPRMLTHTDSAGAIEMLEQHKETNLPTVVVSPSVYTGVSFDDDLARFQIPLRVPYPNVGDPLIKARSEFDRQWYYWCAGTTLFQTFGRVVRNMKDYGVTIMPDSRISYFLKRQLGHKKVPGWITDSMKGPEDLEKDYGLTYDFTDKT